MNHRSLPLAALLPALLFLLLEVNDSQAWTTTSRRSDFFPRIGRSRCAATTSTSRLLLSEKCCDENPNDNFSSTVDGKLKESCTVSAPQSSRRQWLQQGLASSASSTLLLLLQPSKTLAATVASPSIVSTAATCDPTVSVWKQGDRLVYLLGTAHISQISAQLAGQLVQDVHPNAVFVELDLKRIGGLQQTQPAAAEVTNVPTSRLLVPAIPSLSPLSSSSNAIASNNGAPTVVVPMEEDNTNNNNNKKSGSFFGLGVDLGAAAVGNAIRGMYQNLDQAGFRPGDEFVEAVREGRRIGADIVLGDRDVQVTLRRLTQALQVTDWSKLLDPNSELEQSMRELLPSEPQKQLPSADDESAFKEEISAFVESIKTRARVRKIMTQLKEAAPALVQVMLTERDAYMAAGLDSLNQYLVIVAVMGIAHQDGVEQNLRDVGWKQVKPRCR